MTENLRILKIKERDDKRSQVMWIKVWIQEGDRCTISDLTEERKIKI